VGSRFFRGTWRLFVRVSEKHLVLLRSCGGSLRTYHATLLVIWKNQTRRAAINSPTNTFSTLNN
jgi:hypothetical protein